MESSPGEASENGYFRTYRGAVALGVAFLVVGVGLLVSFAIDSTIFFIGVLLSILAVSTVSLSIIVRAEGVVTRANMVIGVFVLLAIGLLLGLSDYTDLSEEIVYAMVIVVGVLVPNLLLEHTRLGGRVT